MAKLRFKMLIVMAGAMAMKAREYARENPEKVAQTLDSVESTVSSRTGGKYDAKIRKGSSALRMGLGVRGTGAGTATGGGTVSDTGTGGGSVSDTGTGGTASPPSSTTPPPPPANGRPDRGAGI